jgi:hypothetical protein
MTQMILVRRGQVAYYRKKAFLVQAIQFTSENRMEVYRFVTNHPAATYDEDGQPALYLQTPAGAKIAHLGDFIVKVEEGDFWVISEVNFYANYDSV